MEGYGDAADRRVKPARITPEGMECARAARREMEAAEKRLLSGLTEAEREIFYTVLKKSGTPWGKAAAVPRRLFHRDCVDFS